MADIIDLSSRLKPGSDLITSQPLEFRKGAWLGSNAVLCTREESERFEAHRQKASLAQDRPFISLVPNHFTLDGGYRFTTLWLFRFREDEPRMRRLYRLAGLKECITEEREKLDVSWKGNVHNFLLPIHPQHYNPNLFLNVVQSASSLKELLTFIEEETNRQFDTLSRHYVFYVPVSFQA